MPINLFKKKISQQDAAILLFQTLHDGIRKNITSDLELLHEYFSLPQNLSSNEEDLIRYDIFIAALALETQAIINLSPQDKNVINCLKDYILKNAGTEVNDYIRSYINIYYSYSKKGENPVSAVAQALYIKIKGRVNSNIKEIDPITTTVIESLLVSKSGTWKTIKNNFKIKK
ncbi:hypothetical protein JCM9140_1875 [Halalkalibacter wakoensis JCM 9140]|uniref:Uncharacterized protein n=1 Tax=Halalkalibacter wakoensis JCM 9140 TaxID=1236970 RepID=W4Q397_9BACI|nr:hypothetical protein [Halalkalibacter wakoensis]GAE25854.1 hypothetical protein JCM9140_1875 [Halalkalibacter wakoensis JCM 9140]